MLSSSFWFFQFWGLHGIQLMVRDWTVREDQPQNENTSQKPWIESEDHMFKWAKVHNNKRTRKPDGIPTPYTPSQKPRRQKRQKKSRRNRRLFAETTGTKNLHPGKPRSSTWNNYVSTREQQSTLQPTTIMKIAVFDDAVLSNVLASHINAASNLCVSTFGPTGVGVTSIVDKLLFMNHSE